MNKNHLRRILSAALCGCLLMSSTAYGGSAAECLLDLDELLRLRSCELLEQAAVLTEGPSHGIMKGL